MSPRTEKQWEWGGVIAASARDVTVRLRLNPGLWTLFYRHRNRGDAFGHVCLIIFPAKNTCPWSNIIHITTGREASGFCGDWISGKWIWKLLHTTISSYYPMTDTCLGPNLASHRCQPQSNSENSLFIFNVATDMSGCVVQDLSFLVFTRFCYSAIYIKVASLTWNTWWWRRNKWR